MEGFILFAVAEGLLLVHTKILIRARTLLVQKWMEGSLSLEELKRLKQAPWFRRHVLKPSKPVEDSKKKD